jgi:hypothetical protein
VGAEFLKEPGMGEQLILERATHRLKLGVKVVVKEYVPSHGRIMILKTYYFNVVKILRSKGGDMGNDMGAGSE